MKHYGVLKWFNVLRCICVQPSSPVDYSGSGECDLKVELTEKMFNSESIATNLTDSRVSVVQHLHVIKSVIDQMIFQF